MNSKLLNILYTLIAASLLVGCRNDVAWSDSKSLPKDGWTADQTIEFMVDPEAYRPEPEDKYAEMTKKAMGDTAKRYLGTYGGRLTLRYLPSCNIDTLRVVVTGESLTSNQRTDTLTFPLFNNSGNPVGKGHLGIFETEVTIPGQVKITRGSFITVTPLPYAEKIIGLTDLTLLLSR